MYSTVYTSAFGATLKLCGQKIPSPLLIHFTIKIFTMIGIYMNIYLCEYLTLPICASAYSECSLVCV